VRVERRDEIRFGLRRFWSSPVIVRIHRLPRFSRLHIFAFVFLHKMLDPYLCSNL